MVGARAVGSRCSVAETGFRRPPRFRGRRPIPQTAVWTKRVVLHDWIAFEINRQIGVCTTEPSLVTEDREEIAAAVFLKLSEILKHDCTRKVMTCSVLYPLLSAVIRMTLSDID